MTTKQILSFAVVCLLASTVSAQTWLIDIGSNDSFRGASVVSPDTNGNHWTSVWAGDFFVDIVDIDGVATDLDFGFSSDGGNDSFNGPAGDTTVNGPADSVYDSMALGNLGVDEAVYDFYVNSTFQIQQLNPESTYNITFYGAHKFNNDATTRYTLYTDDTFSVEVTSVELMVGDQNGPNHNEDMTVTMEGVSPQVDNIFYIGFEGANGLNGYLNCLQIEAVVGFILGDINGDGDVNLLDVSPFVALITSSDFNPAGDFNMDGNVDLLDVAPFVELLTN